MQWESSILTNVRNTEGPCWQELSWKKIDGSTAERVVHWHVIYKEWCRHISVRQTIAVIIIQFTKKTFGSKIQSKIKKIWKGKKKYEY
jgi:hypothetical protein